MSLNRKYFSHIDEQDINEYVDNDASDIEIATQYIDVSTNQDFKKVFGHENLLGLFIGLSSLLAGLGAFWVGYGGFAAVAGFAGFMLLWQTVRSVGFHSIFLASKWQIGMNDVIRQHALSNIITNIADHYALDDEEVLGIVKDAYMKARTDTYNSLHGIKEEVNESN